MRLMSAATASWAPSSPVDGASAAAALAWGMACAGMVRRSWRRRQLCLRRSMARCIESRWRIAPDAPFRASEYSSRCTQPSPFWRVAFWFRRAALKVLYISLAPPRAPAFRASPSEANKASGRQLFTVWNFQSMPSSPLSASCPGPLFSWVIAVNPLFSSQPRRSARASTSARSSRSLEKPGGFLSVPTDVTPPRAPSTCRRTRPRTCPSPFKFAGPAAGRSKPGPLASASEAALRFHVTPAPTKSARSRQTRGYMGFFQGRLCTT
mmetsp:Transcript_2590/g.5673  ORF Transcript_2590/g.5673 Transcript_2590/m.5673 type:complete len:266 (+) Transcript_2590:444-1241(+)